MGGMVGSWLGRGGVTGKGTSMGGTSPVVEKLKEEKPLGGWGTMGQVPGAIAALSENRSPMAPAATNLATSMQAAAPAPSIAQAMQPAPMTNYLDMPSVRRANDAARAAREAASGEGSVTPAAPPAAAVMPPSPAAFLSAPTPASSYAPAGGGGFMENIAQNFRNAMQPAPEMTSIANAFQRGGFTGRKRREDYE